MKKILLNLVVILALIGTVYSTNEVQIRTNIEPEAVVETNAGSQLQTEEILLEKDQSDPIKEDNLKEVVTKVEKTNMRKVHLPLSFSVVYPLSPQGIRDAINKTNSQKVWTVQHLHVNLIGEWAYGLAGFGFSGFNVYDGNIYGVLLNGFNYVKGNIYGLNLGVFSTISLQHSAGLRVGVVNVAQGKGGIGLMVGGVNVVSRYIGLLGGAFNLVKKNSGVAVGAFNLVKKNSGVTVGVVNVIKENRGLTLGYFNYVGNKKGVAIGFLTIVKGMPLNIDYHLNTAKMNEVVLRHGTSYFYNLLSAGFPFGEPRGYFYEICYGIGVKLPFSKIWQDSAISPLEIGTEFSVGSIFVDLIGGGQTTSLISRSYVSYTFLDRIRLIGGFEYRMIFKTYTIPHFIFYNYTVQEDKVDRGTFWTVPDFFLGAGVSI